MSYAFGLYLFLAGWLLGDICRELIHSRKVLAQERARFAASKARVQST